MLYDAYIYRIHPEYIDGKPHCSIYYTIANFKPDFELFGLDKDEAVILKGICESNAMYVLFDFKPDCEENESK